MTTWTAPRTWAVGEKITASRLNTHLRDQFKVVGEAWLSYTPAWTATTTNPVLNNGTLNGFYKEVDKWITYRIELTAGSTTTFGTGSYRLSLPVTARTATTSYAPMGQACLIDTSLSARYMRFAGYSSTTVVFLTDEASTQWGAAAPFAFASTDLVVVQGVYEAA